MTASTQSPKLAPDPSPAFYEPSHSKRSRASARETARHRVIVSVLILACIALLYAFEDLVWRRNSAAHGVVAETWSWMGLLWVVAVLPAAFEAIGLYAWKAPSQPPCHVRKTVCWRVVSRGINIEALTDTIWEIRRQMKAMPLFPYVIEVVMDSYSLMDPVMAEATIDANLAVIMEDEAELAQTPRFSSRARALRKEIRALAEGSEVLAAQAKGLPDQGGDLFYLIVPDDYETPNGTMAKGRSLNYALWNSPLGNRSYICHLDEESRPTESSITGIANAIREEEKAHPERPHVGQGTIVYHRRWEKNAFYTLSDCIRTGSDVGRLYLALKIFHAPLFGMHGSYILIRNDVEKYAGFDIGPKGRLTEDAYWGTLAMALGVRFRWVNGYVAEQCTTGFKDFSKQRRRWFSGMWTTAFGSPAPLRWRFTMIVSMLAWASAPLAWIYTIGHFAHGGYVSPDIRGLANFSLAVYVATTLIGLRINLREHGWTRLSQKIRWSLTWLACLPVLSFMEAGAVAWALVRPAKGWHVVKK